MVRRITLVDAETGETVTDHTYSTPTIGERAQREEKGWVLRRRTAHKRQTGRKVRVVIEQVEA